MCIFIKTNRVNLIHVPCGVLLSYIHNRMVIVVITLKLVDFISSWMSPFWTMKCSLVKKCLIMFLKDKRIVNNIISLVQRVKFFAYDIDSIKRTRDDSACDVKFEVEMVTEATLSEQVTGLSDVPDTKKTPFTSIIVPDHQSLDIPQVIPKVSHYEPKNLNIDVDLYILPTRVNNGKPSDRVSPDDKARYAIEYYASTYSLLSYCQTFINQMIVIKISNKVEDALKDAKWTEHMNLEMEAL